jgi:CRP-like cAMP-binding protein
VYDHAGALAAKSAHTDFKEWYGTAFGAHSPWGAEDSPVLMATAETALERQLSAAIMRGGSKPAVKRLRQGTVLVRQGEPGRELYLLLDGVLRVEVDGETVAEVGPGAVVGERALLEGGRRSATLRALTDGKVAVVEKDQVDPRALGELAAGHRREQ